VSEKYSPTYSITPPIANNEYIFGIHPLYNPKKLQEVYGPLIEYFNKNIPNITFRLEASRNYATYNEKLYAGKFHFALPNPYQTINSIDCGYTVFGKNGDDENFCGIIIIRKDENIKTIDDLKGKAISFPAPTALAATMMPQYFLYENGLDVMNDIDIRYVGSQESSIMSVYSGNTVAAATWPQPWMQFVKNEPELASELEVKWTTKPLINNGLVVRNDISPELIIQIENILFNLHTHEEGRIILERMNLSKFEKANNQTYNIIKTFLERFNKNIRPIKI